MTSFQLPCGKETHEVGKNDSGEWEFARIYDHLETCPDCKKDRTALFKQFAEEIECPKPRGNSVTRD